MKPMLPLYDFRMTRADRPDNEARGLTSSFDEMERELVSCMAPHNHGSSQSTLVAISEDMNSNVLSPRGDCGERFTLAGIDSGTCLKISFFAALACASLLRLGRPCSFHRIDAKRLDRQQDHNDRQGADLGLAHWRG